MKTMQETVGKVLTGIKERQTRRESATTMGLEKLSEWANYFRFDTGGDERTAQQLREMLRASAEFIIAIKAGADPYWLSFLGTSGAGKSYLARKIWDWYRRSSFGMASIDRITGRITYGGSWVFWPSVAGDISTQYGYLTDLEQERFVVLDEIGSDRDPSGHIRDCLARLMSARVGKWTIVTSNKSLGEIQKDIDTRISSRMIRDGSVVLDVDMKDYSLR